MMNCRNLLLAGMVLLASSFSAPKWHALENKDGNFRVEFPGKPQETAKTSNTPSGPMKMNIFMFDGDRAEEGNKMYMVMYTDYPEAVISSGKSKALIDTFFKNAIDGAIANIHGTLVSSENSGIKGYPGKKVKASFSGGKGFMDMQMYLVGNRMYILEVGYQKGEQNIPSEQHFLKSFALLNMPAKK